MPVAAPSWALPDTSAASLRSERPFAAGNWEIPGCSAAVRSAVAGGGAATLAEGLTVAVALGCVAAELEDELGEPDDPQPARTSASRGTRRRAVTNLMSVRGGRPPHRRLLPVVAGASCTHSPRS